MAYSSYGDMSRAFRNLGIQDGYSEDPEGSGLKYATLDLRSRHRSVTQAPRKPAHGRMWTDEDFEPSTAETGWASKPLVWRRPHVINTGSYTPLTDGICHCKLWKFGEWVDIYIDDRLPFYRGLKGLELYGAASWTAPNELWVSLLEKAVAKMYGSYCVVNEGGLPSEAYLALTGGVAEAVQLTSYAYRPHELFQRLEKALETGAMVTCGILSEYDGEFGLMGPHAYALNKTAQVQTRRGEIVCLVRLRNPHGTNEWTGKWSDESPEWKTVVTGGDLRRKRDDGEFWMSLSDFMAKFTQTTICALTPDFDKDGQSDPLKYVRSIFGKWGTAVKISIPEICKKPVYFDQYKGLAPEGTVPVVVQVIQDELRRTNYSNIGCDVFTGDGRTLIQDTERKPRRSVELQNVFRYNLSPGTYILRPSKDERGTSREFLVRLFSPCPIKANQ